MELFPSYINKISMLMPPRWALEAIKGLQQGFTFLEVSKYIAYILILALILLIIVAYMISKEESNKSSISVEVIDDRDKRI